MTREIKGLLKVKTKIYCDLCGDVLKRVKTIPVYSEDEEAAKIETKEKIEKWQKSLIGKNCKICQSILNAHEKDLQRSAK